MSSGLFMTGKHMIEAVAELIEFVIYRHDSPSRIPVEYIHTFGEQTMYDSLCPADVQGWLLIV
jgi:hypothetical protein